MRSVVEHSPASAGFLAQYAGILMVLPFVAMLLIIFFGKRMKHSGAEFAIGAMAINFLVAIGLFIQNIAGTAPSEYAYEIARIGEVAGRDLVFELGWVVDGLSTMMFVVVTTVSLLVFIYAVGYMKGDVRVPNFFANLSLFAGSMLVLVAAPNLVQLIIGWEGVGVASYLLIGHYWEKHENSSAAMKAFYVNRTADVGLTLGTVVLGITLGTFRFTEIFEAAEEHLPALAGVAVAAGLLIFFGAMGKSAQFPLHVWLPDAMAGPTPVSALMHAATMVTAGVYLIARMFPFYEELAAEARTWILWIGAATLFVTGLLALVQNDIKRVLAYSTVSQLGYMMAALGAGGYTAGLFHLWTHAFFKALLFLGAGSVIHAVHSNNMSDMGGLRKHMPITYRTFILGSLALAGIPPLAGFFSKDEILATFNHAGATAVLWLGIAAAFVTAFYTFRMVFLTFHGTYQGHGHPHESPRIMTMPLVALAVGAVAAGWVNIPGVFTGFHHWVENRAVFPIRRGRDRLRSGRLDPGCHRRSAWDLSRLFGLLSRSRFAKRSRSPRDPTSLSRVATQVLPRRSLLAWHRCPDQGPDCPGSQLDQHLRDRRRSSTRPRESRSSWRASCTKASIRRGIDGLIGGVSAAADAAGTAIAQDCRRAGFRTTPPGLCSGRWCWCRR